MPSLEDELRDESKLVKLDASELASFRALRLNQGCSDAVEKILLDAETWRKNAGQHFNNLTLHQIPA